ncbi:MAG: ornithine cyclodeaminase family protein [Candidatus Tectomicrobia bacterium]|uniref:Ornithine cyclodeaminase family protein n=1 Tax=Tectimicrobiota bacterium TaxID=2528274 RepID=A0A932M1X8_UNCTE|nr:ornithine cyclodeaminase family protein [Candidatus Tectomicrobia bacterium]
MPLLLSEDDVRRVLTMDDCLRSLENSCKQEELGAAANRTKSTIYIRSRSGLMCQYVSMEGGIRSPAVFALRLRTHVPTAEQRGPGPERVSMMMLFSGETGELLALLKQRVISSYRVGGMAGLAAREMARPDANVVGIIGSGGLAHAHALAYAAVRKLEQFKVYSPDAGHRTAFAEWITRMTGVPAEALDNAEAVVRGSDIVASCTNARVPILKADWLDQPGVHMTGVQLGNQGELGPEGLKRFQRLVTYLSGVSIHHNTEPGYRPWMNATSEGSLGFFKVIPKHHTLTDVLLKKAPGRESSEERNYFFSEGTGVQFAAVGSVVYSRARERGVGQEMPAEWANWFLCDNPERGSF